MTGDLQITDFLDDAKSFDLVKSEIEKLVNILPTGAKVLVLGFDIDVFKIMAKKNLEVSSFTMQNEIYFKATSEEFFKFAKACSPGSFDVIIDVSFSHHMKKEQLKKFYRFVSRMLKFDSKLLTFVFSSESEYCKEHCPKRLWTYVNDIFVKFSTQAEVKSSVRKNYFSIINYRHLSYAGANKAFHYLTSKLKVKKL